MVDFNSQPSTLNFKQLARRALSSSIITGIIVLLFICMSGCGDDGTAAIKIPTSTATPRITSVPATPTVTPTPDTGSVVIVIPWPTEKGR